MLDSNTRKVDDLLRIVNGGEYYPAVIGRPHWFSPFRTALQSERWEFNLDDQLQAIEDLGRTGNDTALHFLLGLATGTHKTEYRQEVAHGQGSGDCNPYNVDVEDNEIVTFPNARGPLATSLKYSIPLGGYVSSGVAASDPEEVIQKRRSDLLAASRSHTVLAAAIRKLRNDVEGTRV